MSCGLVVLKTVEFIFEKTTAFSAYVFPLCFQVVHFLWYFQNSTAGRHRCLRMPIKQAEEVTKKKTRVTNKNNVSIEVTLIALTFTNKGEFLEQFAVNLVNNEQFIKI